jgi:hypothetical protein
MVFEQSVDEVTVLDVLLHSSSLNDRHVCITNLLLGEVTLSIRGQRKVGENEINRSEAVIKIGVKLGKVTVKLGSDLVT